MAVMWCVKKLANNKPVGYCLDADDSGQRPINPHHSNSQREWELQSLHQRIHSPCTPTLHLCLKSLSLSLSPKIRVCKTYILHTPLTEPTFFLCHDLSCHKHNSSIIFSLRRHTIELQEIANLMRTQCCAGWTALQKCLLQLNSACLLPNYH